MKVAIAAEGRDAGADLARVFGRCPYFLFADTEGGEATARANPAASGSGGAGVQAARFVLAHGAQVVIAPRVGPKAQAVLDAAGVRVARHEGGTVAAALAAFEANRTS